MWGFREDPRVIIPVGIIFIILVVILFQRKRISRFLNSHRHVLRHVLRIIAINVSYMQISTSLPAMIKIPWPQEYLSFVETLNFINFDLVSLMGLECVHVWDYRGRILVALCVPVVGLCLGVAIFLFQRALMYKRAHSKAFVIHLRVRSAEHLFSYADVDGSGEIDETEFRYLLAP